MKTLIIYYSFEGNTKQIADILADQFGGDVVRLETEKVYPKDGLQKYFWGGKSVVFKEQPPLTNTNIQIELYDFILIGTPVWAGSYAPPIRTLLNQYAFQGKKVALFACHAGGGAQKCFAKIKEALPGNDFIGEIDFVDALKHASEETLEKASRWAQSLMNTGGERL